MRTKIFAIVTLFILIIVGGVFFLRNKGESSSLEQLVPSTSIGVLQVKNPAATLTTWAEFDWWDELLQLPFFNDAEFAVNKIDSLLKSGGLGSILTELPLTMSLHVTGSDEIEALYFIEKQGFDWSDKSIRLLIERWYGATPQFEERLYLDQSIVEVEVEGEQLAYLIKDDYLIFSPNVLLIEDAVRAFSEDQLFLPEGLIFDAGSSAVSLTLNWSKFERLKQVFGKEPVSGSMAQGLIVKLDIEAKETGLKWSGSSLLSDQVNMPGEVALRLSNFIPVTASSVMWMELEPGAVPEGVDLSTQEFFETHAGDLTKINLDVNGGDDEVVLIASLAQRQKAEAMLYELASSRMNEGDTLFSEDFMEARITFINADGLIENLYGDRFAGIEQTYYTVFNDVLIYGSSVDVIKAVLTEYDAENTWGRSTERRKYIDALINEANLTLLYNFEYLQQGLRQDLKPAWQSFFNDRSRLTSALDLFSLQVNKTGNGYLVNASLDFNSSIQAKTAGRTTASSVVAAVPEKRMNVFADTLLSTKPFVVTNHNDRSRELVFQDVAGTLYQVSEEGVVMWKKTIGSPVRGSINQVDYYNNRKLQYLFFTDSAVHLIDRNGNDVEDFPRAFTSDLPPLDHRVVDYDNTRRYRYASSDRRGNVSLFDKEVKPLEGWNPKALGSRLLSLPEHVRIRGRDFFVAADIGGNVHLLNRRGEYYPGFPFDQNKRLNGGVAISKGADFDRSMIVTASESGEVVGLDFNGEVKLRNQLFRPDANSIFELVPDRLGSGFVVARNDKSKVVFFNEEEQQVFETPLNPDHDYELSFYNFRNNKAVYLLRNLSQNWVQVMDFQGKSLTPSPIPTIAPIGIIYYQNRAEYEVFVNFANEMAIYTLSK